VGVLGGHVLGEAGFSVGDVFAKGSYEEVFCP